MATKKADKKTGSTAKAGSQSGLDLGSIASGLGNIDIAEQVQTVVKKLSSDNGLLEKFKTNALAVVKKILPAIKDKNILNSIVEAVKAKLNLTDLIGGLTGQKTDGKTDAKDDGKNDGKNDGGLLGGLASLLTGKK